MSPAPENGDVAAPELGRSWLRRRITTPMVASVALGAPAGATMEFPVYAPGEAIDAEGYVVGPPRQGIRPRRRSTLQRVLIRLSSGTLLIIVGGVLALATLFSPIGARRAARAAAEQELASELEPGERVLGRAYVSQRNWWDNFRESFGVLAATDRRLLYVGLPPAPWLSRMADGPPELRAQSFPYDAPFVAEARRLFGGFTRGVLVKTTAGDVAFLVPRGEAARVRDIERVVDRAQIARTEALEREQLARSAPPPPPTVYGTHTVRYGDAVTSIARRYRTTPDVIRQLNRLQNDRIRAGQRLRVPIPPGTTDSAAVRVPATGARPQAITY
jgi:LysM repeat protein